MSHLNERVARAAVWGPVLVVALFATLPEALQARLAWDRGAIEGGEYWRLWSGHFVHWGAAHAATNGVLLAVLGFGLQRGDGLGGRRSWPLLLAPAVMSLALLALAPLMGVYRGASGLVAMLVVALCIDAILSRRNRLPGAVLLLALLLKTGLEAAGLDLASSLPAGVAVAWPVHVLGGLAGCLWALLRRRHAPLACPA